MKNIKEKRGITLIALAVTIVVILILAGVTIDAVFSENGILNKAKEAANAMNNAITNDQIELNELFSELNEVMNGWWSGETGENEDTNQDPEPEKPTDIEDVTDIQDETVTVEDEYGNKVTIPKGFEVVEEEGITVPEGIVIQDANGNQFVWIPVGRVYKDASKTNYSDIQLGRYTFNTNNGTPTPVQLAYTEESPENYKQLVSLNFDGNNYQEYATRANPDGIVSSGTNGLNAIAKDLEGFVNSVRDNGGYYLGRIVFIQEMGHTNYANKNSVNKEIKNTGTIGDEVCNIHDMSSNIEEWTTEYCTNSDSNMARPCTERRRILFSG